MKNKVLLILTLAAWSPIYAGPNTTNAKKCESGSVKACLASAQAYEKQKDWLNAGIYWDKTSGLGDNSAYYRLAVTWAKQNNKAMAGYVLEDGCQKGCVQCCGPSKELDKFAAQYSTEAAEWDEHSEARITKEKELERQAERLQQAENERLKELRRKKISTNQKKCSEKLIKACVDLGTDLLADERGGEAKDAFEKACELRSSEGCRLAGLLNLKEGSSKFGLRLLKEACTMKDFRACKSVDSYEESLEQSKVDQERAMLEAEESQRRQEAEEHDEIVRQENENRRNRAIAESLSAIGKAFAPPPRKPKTTCNTRREWGGNIVTECEGN